MKLELILVANAAHARLFSRETDGDPLVPLNTLENPAGRAKASELGDDRLGHESSDHHAGGVSFEARTDPRRKQHQVFAEQLSEQVDLALQSGRYARVTVFASNPFLGQFKDSLSPAALKVLRAAQNADLTSYDLGELDARIARALHGS